MQKLDIFSLHLELVVIINVIIVIIIPKIPTKIMIEYGDIYFKSIRTFALTRVYAIIIDIKLMPIIKRKIIIYFEFPVKRFIMSYADCVF